MGPVGRSGTAGHNPYVEPGILIYHQKQILRVSLFFVVYSFNIFKRMICSEKFSKNVHEQFRLSQNRPEREKKVKQISYGRQLSDKVSIT